MYPKSFQRLIKNLSSLPSIGPKHAERLVLYLFKKNADEIKEFAENLLDIKNLQFCKKCNNISEGENCQICKDTKRDHSIICVVEDPLDVISIERTRVFQGIYHVLGGVMTATDKDSTLKIPELIQRIQSEETKEVILATNPTTEGDTTSLYLKRKLSPLGIKISRLGRGLSTGADLEYTDELTLSEALTNRKELL